MDGVIALASSYWWAVLIVVVIVGIFVVKQLSRNFGGETVEVTAQQAAEIIEQQNGLLIDLAEQRTYDKGHIPGSINMPGVTFVDGSATLSDTTRPVVLVPMKGLIPMPVIEYMNAQGVPQIYILKGGLAAWQEAGLPS